MCGGCPSNLESARAFSSSISSICGGRVPGGGGAGALAAAGRGGGAMGSAGLLFSLLASASCDDVSSWLWLSGSVGDEGSGERSRGAPVEMPAECQGLGGGGGSRGMWKSLRAICGPRRSRQHRGDPPGGREETARGTYVVESREDVEAQVRPERAAPLG